MKIAINHRHVDGPWGGGNRFVAALAAALTARGDSVVHKLEDDDIDLLLLIDPRARNPQLAFTPGDALRYVTSRRPQALVIHRINECDERKGTRTMNPRLRLANYCADHTVFIASWLKDLAVWRREGGSCVILNGGDDAVFRRDSAARWDGTVPLRLVTHHWGAHFNKGWDVYPVLDRMLGEQRWRERVSFCFIGNHPADATLAHIEFRKPLDGAALAATLAEHHAYVTASIGEPGGMHHIEGALVGLPILFRRSGALPEYCSPYGIGFDGPDDFPAALEAFVHAYTTLKPKIAAYPHTAERMTREYLALFDRLLTDRAHIAAARRPWRSPVANLLNRLPL
jgi:hypothetical protein